MRDLDKRKVSSKTGRGLVCGLPTEIVITEFENKFFILITDSGKIGSLVQVLQKTSESENICSSRVLFGKDTPEIQAVACALAETCKFPKPVVFGLSLKDYSASSVKDLKTLLSTVVGKPPGETEHPCR
ncbi:hypothetical protein AVEN_97873-1 [Araneus ventricosus]|uniref:Uncharacterized protein n=1 Tax=Araneus ventricosus TaxID=182803 RepID=A0A4Y2F3J1_ARAVE|nr:hypothetical protein AVEN_97873-1 [Araneus ventricosus]